jgi:hypothetical protein
VIVDAAKIEVVVISNTVVSLSKVTGYGLKIVEAGWIDVSMSVRVS